jgi:[ribosomal protein S18]-alanine N-acetyltransferase
MPAHDERIDSSWAVTVRRMSAPEVPSALAILEESPEASLWSRDSLVDSAAQGMAWVAELDGHVAGILIGRLVADEFEILNLAVEGRYRRRGVATKLLSVALETARTAGALKTYLEVRASNLGGIALYRHLGFNEYGRRPNYYHEPAEDAVLLVLHTNGTNS